MAAATYKIGDKVRLLQVPQSLLALENPVAIETAAFISLCVGKVFTVRGFDEHGQLELWTTDKGNERKRGLGLKTHWIWTEPEYVELVTLNEQ